MSDNNRLHREKPNLTTWVEKIQKWIGLAATILGGLGLTLSAMFNWLEEHPGLRLSTQLASIFLILVPLWLLCFYIRKAMKTHVSKLSLDKEITEHRFSNPIRLLTTSLVLIFTIGGMILGYQIIKQFRNDDKKIIVLIARFDGKKEDEQRVTTHIFEGVKEATKDIPGVDVRSLDEIITAEQGSKKAREKGEARNAKLVLWGWYDSDLIGSVHLEPLLSPFVNASLKENQRKFSAVSEGGGIAVKQRLSGELSYVTLLTIGLLRGEAGAYNEALIILSKALAYPEMKSVADPSTIYFYRANIFRYKEKFDEALSDYNLSIKLRPDYAEAFYNRGWLYDYTKKLDEALADYTQAIKLKPNYAEAYNNRGGVYGDKRKIDEALTDYTQAIMLKPDLAEAYYNRGFLYDYKLKLDEALNDYGQAIKLRPDLAEAYCSRGLIFGRKRRFDEALVDCNEAIKLKPDLAEAYFSRGIIYYNKGELDDALNDYNRAVELKPKFAEAYNNRANVRRDKRQFDEALADCNEAIKLKPDLAEAYDSRCNIYHDKGKLSEALADCDKGIKFRPDLAEIYVSRGKVYYDKEEINKALADYNQAISLNSDLAEAYYSRGILYQQKNDKQNAIDDLRKSTLLFFHPKEREDALDRLRSLGVKAGRAPTR